MYAGLHIADHRDSSISSLSPIGNKASGGEVDSTRAPRHTSPISDPVRLIHVKICFMQVCSLTPFFEAYFKLLSTLPAYVSSPVPLWLKLPRATCSESLIVLWASYSLIAILSPLFPILCAAARRHRLLQVDCGSASPSDHLPRRDPALVAAGESVSVPEDPIFVASKNRV